MLLPPPDISAAYVDDAKRPTKDFYNWVKSLDGFTRSSGVASPFVNAVDFGADPTGANESSTFINNAINSLPALGGDVIFPVGVYKISSTIVCGNGTASAFSTKNGINLVGLGGMAASNQTGGTFPGSVVFRWAGSTGAGPVVKFAGPISGWGMSNIVIDGVTTAQPNQGVILTSACFGLMQNVNIIFAQTHCLLLNTYDPASAACNTMHNTFINVSVDCTPSVSNPRGIQLDGGGTASPACNSCFNNFINTTIECGNAVGTVGLYLKVCDGNTFVGTHIDGGGANNNGITFDYTLNNTYPTGNMFFMVDNALATQWQNFAAPGSASISNYVFGISHANGGAAPVGIAGATYFDQFSANASPLVVAGLPSPTGAMAGTRALVSNATATTFASVVAGGGGNTVPVYCDGSNWRIG